MTDHVPTPLTAAAGRNGPAERIGSIKLAGYGSFTEPIYRGSWIIRSIKRTAERDDGHQTDRAAFLADPEWAEDPHRAGGNGAAVQHPWRRYRQGRAIRPGFPEDQPE